MGVEQEVLSWGDLFAGRTRTGFGTEIADIMALANRRDIISFSGGVPDPLTFPGAPLVEVLGDIVGSGDPTAFQYAPTPGLPSFRDYLAERLETLHGRRPAEAELLVTSGGIEAIELLALAFVDAGDAVVVEAPTYLGSVMGFVGLEARVVGIAMDGAGLEVDALERELDAGLRPKLLYTIPDYQNPTGLTLSEDRRLELVELARRFRFLVVEDVAYRELTFEAGGQPPSLWSLAPDVVLQISTFSKTFCPGVRLGWAVGPAEVVAELVRAKQNTDQCAAALGQRLVEEYGRRGLLDEQIGRSRELYGTRCRLTMEALERSSPPDIDWTRPQGGFFTWLTLDGSLDSVEIAARAMEEGVAIVPGVPFFADGRGRDGIRISFSRATGDEIAEGFGRLGRLLAAAPR
jgi:2-aminoadipate transaminase